MHRLDAVVNWKSEFRTLRVCVHMDCGHRPIESERSADAFGMRFLMWWPHRWIDATHWVRNGIRRRKYKCEICLCSCKLFWRVARDDLFHNDALNIFLSRFFFAFILIFSVGDAEAEIVGWSNGDKKKTSTWFMADPFFVNKKKCKYCSIVCVSIGSELTQYSVWTRYKVCRTSEFSSATTPWGSDSSVGWSD